MTTHLDLFTRAYLTAALFTEDPNPSQGEFCERDNWSIDCIDDASILEASNDCVLFQEKAGERIADDLEHAGRDFWYTRNGHGCGFWDGDWSEADGKFLTDLAKTFGESYLSVSIQIGAV